MNRNIIQKIINFFGYKFTKFKTIDHIDLDLLTKFLTDTEKPIIFDVGANKGLSILRYKKIFPGSIIHCFEPDKNEVEKLVLKYQNENSIVLNSVAVGEKPGNLEFNINVVSGHSSFKNLIPNTTWIKKRSQSLGIKSEKYNLKKINTDIITLDDYCSKKNINKIDILKIDTQGYEDKVLEGAINLLKQNKIKVIQLELIHSEIYENPLNIYDVEKHLIPNKYKFFGATNGGSLISHYIFEQDFIYISSDIYDNFKKNKSPHFNN